MLNEGDITQAQYDWAVSRGLGLKAGKLYKEIREPYFFGYVRDQLIAEYGAGTVRSGGLKVYTTIDPRFQRAAQKAIKETLYEPDDPAAGVISINPKNGAIRAMTAVMPGEQEEPVQPALAGAAPVRLDVQDVRARRRRREGDQPGDDDVSLGAVLLPARPERELRGRLLVVPRDLRPQLHRLDDDRTGHAPLGQHRLRAADARRDAGGGRRHGPPLGVRSPLSVDGAFVPSIGLGAMDVSPLDMASAYATLAAGGIYSEPMAIRKVILPTGEDKNAGWGKPKRKRVISDGVAWTVTQILEENIQYGTGAGANYGAPAAGKTGTTEEHSDAWFCGYTPRLGTTVWVGYPRGKVPMTSVHGISVAGGTFPAQIWRLFMDSAIGQLEPVDFAEPKDYPEWEEFERASTRGRSATTRTTTTTTRHRRRPARRLRRNRRTPCPMRRPPRSRRLRRPSPRPRPRRRRRRRRRPRRRPSLRPRRPPSPNSPTRPALLAAGAVAVLVAGCVACAWVEGAPLVPADGGRADGGSLGALFLALLVARVRRIPGGARALPAGDTCAPRRRGRRLRDPVDPARRSVAGLDRRVDVLGVRPDCRRARRRSLCRHAERVPGRPGLRQGRRGLARNDVGLRARVHAALRSRRARLRLVGGCRGLDLQGAGGARDAGLHAACGAAGPRKGPTRPRSSAGTRSSRSTSPAVGTTTPS